MVGFVGGQPVGQAGLEALAAGWEGGQPDGLERRQQQVRRLLLGASGYAGRGHRGPGPQGADGGPAVLAEKFHQFVKDFGFVLPPGAGVTRAPFGQHFLSGNFTHWGVHV